MVPDCEFAGIYAALFRFTFVLKLQAVQTVYELKEIFI